MKSKPIAMAIAFIIPSRLLKTTPNPQPRVVRESMRGADDQQNQMFSYLSPEAQVRKDHPLRAIRAMVDEVLTQMSGRFYAMYASVGRPSIPPEKLLRAQLLQMLYSVRSERLLMEEMDYNLLFRWFVGLNADDDVWDATTFTKNRDRLLEADVAKQFLAQVVAQAGARDLTSDEHFTVDGTLLDAWASVKSFQPKEGKNAPPPDDPGNPTSHAVRAALSLLRSTRTAVKSQQGRSGAAIPLIAPDGILAAMPRYCPSVQLRALPSPPILGLTRRQQRHKPICFSCC